MGQPRPTFWEAWAIGVCRVFQGFGVLFAVGATLILFVNTVVLVRSGELSELGLTLTIIPLFYAAAGCFFFLGRTFARRLEKDARDMGDW